MGLVVLLGAGCSNTELLDMTLLHINDHHSHLEPEHFDLDARELGLTAVDAGGVPVEMVQVQYGGMPMLATLFAEVEATVVNPVKIHAGDAITGTLYYSTIGGKADAALMNEICFDIFALGNHEFDDGDAGLATFLDELGVGDCNTPVLAANVLPAPTSPIREGYIQPYTILTLDNEKVGFIGIDIAQKTKQSSRPDEGTEFLDETETSQRYIDELRDQGVERIVLVTHYGYENDLELAANLSGVDIIVGGDSHTLLGAPSLEALGWGPAGDYPTRVTDRDGNPVCVVQAWEYAHLLGQLSVFFDQDGITVGCDGTPISPVNPSEITYTFSSSETRGLSADDTAKVVDALATYSELVLTTPDASADKTLSVFSKELQTLKTTVIAQVPELLCLERFPGQGQDITCDASERGSDISNVVAKAFLEETLTADIAIQNGGGVRSSVRPGPFTISDAITLLPFSNTLVTLELTGQQIINVLEDALSNHLDQSGSTGSYPYASGLRFNVDASALKGSRVTAVEVNPRLQGTWMPINVAATYVVVSSDYLASGRDGYATFTEATNIINTYTEYSQGLINYATVATTLEKVSFAEYSTQVYVGRDGCNHSTQTCTGY